jgi:hypothetical protein
MGRPEREWIEVGEKVVAVDKGGTNLVAINPTTGSIEGNVGRGLQGGDVTRFLQDTPDGYIVVGMLKWDGPGFLRRRARQALKVVGVAGTPDEAWAHVFVGVKGAEYGSAIEALAEKSAIGLQLLAGNVGHPLSVQGLEARLKEAARKASGGHAVYVGGLEESSRIAVAKSSAGGG